MSRRFRPRPAERFPKGLLPVTCDDCGHRGAYDWRRGVVVHPWTARCVVQAPVVVDEQEAEAA